jgi:hypothetical protein
MQEKLKKYTLGFCLFVFLFVIIGGGFHLTSAATFIAAVSGTPLVIYAFNCWCNAQLHGERANREEPASEIIPVRERS